MTRIKTVDLYEFNELNDEAKERARDWYRRCNDTDDWAEFIIDDFATIVDMIGITLKTKSVRLMGGGTREDPCVWYSVSYSQGDGASFEGTYSHKKSALKAVKAYAPADEALHTIVKRLVDVQRANFYELTATISTDSKYSHTGTMRVDVERENDHDQSPSYGAEDEVTDCLRSLADWLYRRLVVEYEYLNSNEVIDEMMEANGYTFDEDGHRMD